MSAQTASEPQSSLAAKYWLGPYAIVVSSLYLWGYWGSFHVNVLEYIGIAEIVKAAVYPIASAFVFFAIGAVLGEVMSPTLNLPPGGGANTRIGHWVRRLAPFMGAAYVLAILFYFLLGPIEKWRSLPILFATIVYLPLKSTGILRDELKSDGARSVALFLLATLVPFSYGRGALEANDVLTGRSYAFAAAELPSHAPPADAKPSEKPRYVGRANDRYVFFDPIAQSISFVAASEVKALILKRYEEPTASAVTSAASSAASSSSARPPSAPASAPTSGRAAS